MPGSRLSGLIVFQRILRSLLDFHLVGFIKFLARFTAQPAADKGAQDKNPGQSHLNF